MRRLLAALAVTVGFLGASATVALADGFCAPGAVPRFQFGFATLSLQLGQVLGTPIECEHPNAANGDTLQKTSTGLAFYRKSTNTPTFTDGYNHWGLTRDGLLSWTGSSIDPPIEALVTVAETAPTVTSPAQVPVVGPQLGGASPTYCEWTTQLAARVYFCSYPSGTDAEWQDQNGRWVLLVTVKTGGASVFTEDGNYAFGKTNSGDPWYRNVRPQDCLDGSTPSGAYRLCTYPGQVVAAWIPQGGAWTLNAYKIPPATDFTFVRATPPPLVAPPAPVVINNPPPAVSGSVVESRIDGEFTGWDGETIFKLLNGQIWQQSSNAYTYHYAYNPGVLIYASGGSWRMRVDGVDQTIAVVRLR